MKNCDCTQNCGGGFIPKPSPNRESCACKPDHITLRTKVIPANLGGPSGAYAPKPGAEYNTIVVYLATGDIYEYDSNGVFTCMFDGSLLQLANTIQGIESQTDELVAPVVPALTVNTYEELEAVEPSTVPSGGFVEVTQDETHDGRDTLYYYNAVSKGWVFDTYASPYYQKPVVDNLTTELGDLSQKLDEYVNSPDVRYIVDTYAALEAIDKSTIGDQDYARVLQDETREGASTYYQFNKAAQTWAYIGMTGPYYTKEEIDNMIGEAVTRLEAI